MKTQDADTPTFYRVFYRKAFVSVLQHDAETGLHSRGCAKLKIVYMSIPSGCRRRPTFRVGGGEGVLKNVYISTLRECRHRLTFWAVLLKDFVSILHQDAETGLHSVEMGGILKVFVSVLDQDVDTGLHSEGAWGLTKRVYLHTLPGCRLRLTF